MADPGAGFERSVATILATIADEDVKELDLEWDRDLTVDDLVRIINALQSHANIKTLRFHNSEIGDEKGVAVARAMQTNTTITFLDVSKSSLGKTAGDTFADMIRTNTTLQKLSLYFNNIGDESGANILYALATNASLKIVDVGFNGLAQATGRALVEVIKTNTTLIDLDLNGNSHLLYDDATGVALAHAFANNNTLTSLRVYTCTYDVDLEDVKKALIDVLKTSNHTLCHFDYYFNMHNPEPVDLELERLLNRNKELIKHDWKFKFLERQSKKEYKDEAERRKNLGHLHVLPPDILNTLFDKKERLKLLLI